MGARAIHADAVITGDRHVHADGAVVVSDDGLVLDVGPAGEVLPRNAGAPVERVRGVVFPGLVNAHTHVELSALRGRVPGGAGFVAWVDAFVRARAAVTDEEEAEAIERAAADLEAYGTVAVGDVSNRLSAVRALARHGIGGAVFHEVFGREEKALRVRVAALPGELEARVGAWPSPDLAYAAAPHTLYTTHAPVVRELLATAKAKGQRTTLHLAEHVAERQALERGEGPMAAWLDGMSEAPAGRGLRQEARTGLPKGAFAWPMQSPIDFADSLGALAPHVLLVHLTDARPHELRRVAESGAKVVLCPRSNLTIDLALPPLLAMREAGIEAALGTDSLASNASLDVLAEARALADRFPQVPAKELVQMATWNGARALGRDDLGRIARGSRPGLVAVLGEASEDPCAFLLRRAGAPRRTLVGRQLSLRGAA